MQKAPFRTDWRPAPRTPPGDTYGSQIKALQAGGKRMFEGRAVTVNLRAGPRSTIAHYIRRAWAAVTGVLAPPLCCLCAGPGRAGSHALQPLDCCEHCIAALPASYDSSPLPCGPVWALGSYDYPTDHMIRALKFHGERVHARVLGTLLGELRATDRRPLPQMVIPVPLHRARFAERGFNQAAEIARYAAQVLRLPLDERILTRPHATLEQSDLPAAARHRNVRGAFEVARWPVPPRVALVDDVLTTGSTLTEAARVLQMAGAASIEIWVAARVADAAENWLRPEFRQAPSA
jgi:ComF family protein